MLLQDSKYLVRAKAFSKYDRLFSISKIIILSPLYPKSIFRFIYFNAANNITVLFHYVNVRDSNLLK